MDEFLNCMRMLLLLCKGPTDAGLWLKYDRRQEGSLVVQVAGMPLTWKVINFLFVLLPKVVIFKSTAETGTTFLMESAGIADVIVNAVALTFVIGISQLAFSTFS